MTFPAETHRSGNMIAKSSSAAPPASSGEPGFASEPVVNVPSWTIPYETPGASPAVNQPGGVRPPARETQPAADGQPTLSEESTVTMTESLAIVVPPATEAAAPSMTVQITPEKWPVQPTEAEPALAAPPVALPNERPPALTAGPNSDYANMLASILHEQGYHSYCSSLLHIPGAVTKTSTIITTITQPTPVVVYAAFSTTTSTASGNPLTPAAPVIRSAEPSRRGMKESGQEVIHTAVGKKPNITLQAKSFLKRQAAATSGLAYLNPTLVSAACGSIITPTAQNIVVTEVTTTVTEFTNTSLTVYSATHTVLESSFSTFVVSENGRVIRAF